MSRFQGYVGIANFMGARFTASEAALAPVLRETAQARADLRRRRLLAAQPRRPDRRRQQPAVRQGRGRARRGADAGARSTARWRGSRRWRASAASRSASPAALPASIDRIAQWAKAAEGRGIVLVPITAVAIEAEVELTVSERDAELVDRSRLSDTGTTLLAHRQSAMTNAPIRRPALSPLRRHHACSTATASSSSAGAPTGPSSRRRRTSGRCRRAASTRARSPIAAALRELYEETSIRRSRSSARSGLADLRHSARDRRQGLEGQVSRPEAEMVRAALHRQGQRDRHRRLRAAATSRNSSTGAGSRWRIFPT